MKITKEENFQNINEGDIINLVKKYIDDIKNLEYSKEIINIQDLLENITTYTMTSRGLDSEVELNGDYRIYMVMDRVTTKDGIAVPWHYSKGGAAQSVLTDNSYYDHVEYKFINSCATDVKTRKSL